MPIVNKYVGEPKQFTEFNFGKKFLRREFVRKYSLKWDLLRRNGEYRNDFKEYFIAIEQYNNVVGELKKEHEHLRSKIRITFPLNPSRTFSELISNKRFLPMIIGAFSNFFPNTQFPFSVKNPVTPVVYHNITDTDITFDFKNGRPRFRRGLGVYTNIDFSGILFNEITLRVNLAPSFGLIKKDVEGTLERWKKIYDKYNPPENERIHFEKRLEYLKIYDLMPELKNPREVARIVYKKEYYELVKRGGKDTRISVMSLIKKVEHNYKEINGLIKQQGGIIKI